MLNFYVVGIDSIHISGIKRKNKNKKKKRKDIKVHCSLSHSRVSIIYNEQQMMLEEKKIEIQE